MAFLKLVLLAVVAACNAQGNTTWLISLGHSYGAHEYIDSTGYLKGFGYDLVAGVCEAAGITCKTVWDKYTNAWQSPAGQHPCGGVGLHDQYYHASLGWWQTIERQHVFSFSQQYTNPPLANFYVKPGNPGNFDKNDITGKKIGFISGWATDEKCLARMTDSVTGAFLPAGMVVHASTPDSITALLANGDIDAIFCSTDTMGQYVISGQVEKLELNGQCLLAGACIMARKDSPFPAIWDSAFDAFVASGGFQQICDNVATEHGTYGTIDCITV